MSRIAVVGSGISGLSAAYYLSAKHEVHVFESEHRLGGHTATMDVHVAGQDWAIDTGFIVCNDRTYPRFLALLEELGVSIQATEMSFSVHNPVTGLQYNGHDFASLFAQRRNAFNPRFLKMLGEIVRFNRLCKSALAEGRIDENHTLGQFLQQHRFSDYFASHYILPMAAAIWSATIGEVRQFPIAFFVQFFNNHGLLNVADRPQWYSVVGGSRAYIPKLSAPYADRVRTQASVQRIVRSQEGVWVHALGQEPECFDQVVLACHSDQALAMLEQPSAAEQAVLSAIGYRNNEVVLHTDATMLPPQRRAWAAWNYHLSDEQHSASVTYSMNILQCLPAQAPEFCVTLNRSDDIDPAKILGRYRYAHPVFSREMVAAQRRWGEISGADRVHFCGAYWYSGFHEDGLHSAQDVCRSLGALA